MTSAVERNKRKAIISQQKYSQFVIEMSESKGESSPVPTEEELKAVLSSLEYSVLRQKVPISEAM